MNKEQIEKLKKGDRLRWTISGQTCTVNRIIPQGMYPPAVLLDFDEAGWGSASYSDLADYELIKDGE